MSVLVNKVEVRSVSKSFPQRGVSSSRFLSSRSGERTALLPTNLVAREGEFICLVGPSGCGKTTLLNIIAGLLPASSGSVVVEGNPIKGPGRDRMMMFQESALFPWRTALGNVMFGLQFVKEIPKSERKRIALEHLALVGLKGFEYRFIHELSGGMKQRVALARSLAPNPQVLLMDEPFAALDAMTREQLYQDLQRICGQYKKTVIFVTHNAREAACLADRVLVFSPTPGRVTDVIQVRLPRPRDINDAAVAATAREISKALREAHDPISDMANGVSSIQKQNGQQQEGDVCAAPLSANS